MAKPNPLDAFAKGTTGNDFQVRQAPVLSEHIKQHGLMDGIERYGQAMQQWVDELVAAVRKLQPATATTTTTTQTTTSPPTKTPAEPQFTPVNPIVPKLHGDGPPSASLGQAGDTYVDDSGGGFYWKTKTGWRP